MILLFWLWITDPKCPKQVCISLLYLQKNMSYEIDFLPADKHKIFLQIDSITLGVHDQACPKHPIKQQLYDIFAISWWKREGCSWFFPAANCQTFLQSDTVIFDVCDQTLPRHYQNKNFAISLQYLKREVNDKVDVLHAGKHENLLQIDTVILTEMVKHFQSSQNGKFTLSVQYLKKRS